MLINVGDDIMLMIDTYSFGLVVVNGRRYSSDVIVYRDRVRENWWRRSGHHLSIEDIEEVIEERPEVLIIGTGSSGVMKVPKEVVEFIRGRGIEVHVLRTKEACELFNKLEKTRNVVAALHLTC